MQTLVTDTCPLHTIFPQGNIPATAIDCTYLCIYSYMHILYGMFIFGETMLE